MVARLDKAEQQGEHTHSESKHGKGHQDFLLDQVDRRITSRGAGGVVIAEDRTPRDRANEVGAFVRRSAVPDRVAEAVVDVDSRGAQDFLGDRRETGYAIDLYSRRRPVPCRSSLA